MSKNVSIKQGWYNQQKRAMKSNYDIDMIPHELKYSLDEAEKLLDDLEHGNQRMFVLTALIY